MSLKMKLTSTIIAFFLVLGLVIMGVMAAPSATVNLGGTITFQATNVYAKVTGKISGTKAETQPTLDDITIDDKTVDGDISTWSSQDLAFKDDGSAITIEVTIENLATDRKLYAYITDTKQNVANVNKTMKQGEADYADTELITLDSTTTKTTITLSMEIADKNASLATGSLYGYNIVLMDISGVPSYDTVEGLTIECNTTDKVASITGNSITSENSDVIIPSYVKSGDVICAVTSIANNAFFGSSITSVQFPKTLTTIGGYAFDSSSLTGDLIIPEGVTSIGDSALEFCNNLTSVEFADSIVNIGHSMFSMCPNLKSVKMPKDLTKVPQNFFTQCNNLISVSMPENLTTIGYMAFGYCSSLASITLGDGVTSIESDAFAGCNALATINYRGTQDQWKLISIGSNNDPLSAATINYNYAG